MLRVIFVLVVLAAGVLGGLRSRYVALLAYVWFSVFRPQEWVWFDISALRGSLILGLVLVVPALATGILPNLTHPISLFAMLFVLASLGSQVTAVSPTLGWETIDTHARLVLVVLFAVSILNSRERIRGFIVVLAVSFGFHTTKAGLASLVGGGLQFGAGLGGAFADNNGYALGAVMTVPFLWGASQLLKDADDKWTRAASVGFLVAIPLTCLMIVGTNSRGGLLALAMSAGVFIALRRNRAKPLLILATFIAVGLPFVPVPDGYADRIKTIATYEDIGEDSALGRLHFWEVARHMASRNLFGVGLGGYNNAYDRYDFSRGFYGSGRSVHSSHFQVLGELGYVGLVCWVALFVLTYRSAFRVRRFADDSRLSADEALFFRMTADATIISITGFLVGGAFLAASRNEITWFTFALAVALDRLRASQQRAWSSARVPLQPAPSYLALATSRPSVRGRVNA
jgi:probable O-glycosylation ligase (exosortase A-associated)